MNYIEHVTECVRLMGEINAAHERGATDTDPPIKAMWRQAEAHARFAAERAMPGDVRDSIAHSDLLEHLQKCWGPNACTSVHKGIDGTWDLAVFASRTEDDCLCVMMRSVPTAQWPLALYALKQCVVHPSDDRLGIHPRR